MRLLHQGTASQPHADDGDRQQHHLPRPFVSLLRQFGGDEPAPPPRAPALSSGTAAAILVLGPASPSRPAGQPEW